MVPGVGSLPTQMAHTLSPDGFNNVRAGSDAYGQVEESIAISKISRAPLSAVSRAPARPTNSSIRSREPADWAATLTASGGVTSGLVGVTRGSVDRAICIRFGWMFYRLG